MPADAPSIEIRVAWSGAPGHAEELVLRVPRGATVGDAIAAWRAASGAELDASRVGIWGRRAAPHTPLAPDDRVEIYRPLQLDPMEARRLRQRRQRAARGSATCSPKR